MKVDGKLITSIEVDPMASGSRCGSLKIDKTKYPKTFTMAQLHYEQLAAILKAEKVEIKAAEEREELLRLVQIHGLPDGLVRYTANADREPLVELDDSPEGKDA